MTLGLLLLSLTPLLRAQDAPDNQTLTPYGAALLDYKTDRYKDALTAINEAENEKPGDPATEILKARILTELGDFAGAEQVLRPLLTPNGPVQIEVALGDLFLRKRSFDSAAKYYSLALQAAPNDPDITLKLVYAKIGVSDFVEAQRYASHLTPFDSKNPYDDHASYYFARAALAQATGKSEEADEDIQNARTNYGITVTNRYLKTYLQFFSPPDKDASTDLTPLRKP